MKVTLYAPDVSLIWSSAQKSKKLMDKGVHLSDYWGSPVKFDFTELNKIKPSMLREAADQLAADAHITLAALSNATQGLLDDQ
ncbi:hypothetical protein DK880_00901 [Candidatus Cardinium hertigii]|uniref:Uncharacterized protein n=2 Tax=Candidatus Cardinium hertigii TaxID=247481 RepID=A0A2Z3LA27_9BACT|nr:hypothetical protein DK880_00901 [Candidatus Cardinium hertigii]